MCTQLATVRYSTIGLNTSSMLNATKCGLPPSTVQYMHSTLLVSAPRLPPAVDCGNLNSINNGAVDTSSGTTYQHIAVYTCVRGYVLSGVQTRTCLADGLWSEAEPKCNSELDAST